MPEEIPACETRDVKTLKDFPLQEQVHGTLNQQKVDQLAADIELRGLMHPIEILPDGTVLCGHHRLAALRRLGRTKIPVIVRDDFAKATHWEVTEHFLKDNLIRNHHGPLAQARMIAALDDVLRDLGEAKGSQRDRLAKAFSEATAEVISAKTIYRRLKLLELPIVLQQFVDQGTMTQAKALKVVQLPPEKQDKLAEAVSLASKPGEIVDKFLAESVSVPVKSPALDVMADRVVSLCIDLSQLSRQQRQMLGLMIVERDVDPAMLETLKSFLEMQMPSESTQERVA